MALLALPLVSQGAPVTVTATGVGDRGDLLRVTVRRIRNQGHVFLCVSLAGSNWSQKSGYRFTAHYLTTGK